MILPAHRRVVLWGFTSSLDSFRHIHRHYQHALERLGKPVVWIPDEPESRDLLVSGDLVFAVDVEAHQLGAPVSGVDYLLHNLDGSHPVFDGLEPERLLRLQVYTSAADQYGVEWAPARRYDREQRTLFQPWGTDLLADEFLPPVFAKRSRQAAFVGSVWDDNGLGNIDAIRELTAALVAHRLRLTHYSHVPDAVNVNLVRRSRIAPAVAGGWQVSHAYLPCRVFKQPSYGALAITNVARFRTIFAGCSLQSETIAGLVDEALALTGRDYLELVAAQQQVVAGPRRMYGASAVAGYTYEQSLEAIGRAFEEGR